MGKFVKGDVVIIPFPFTEDKNIILYVAGHLNENKIRDTLNAIIGIVSS
jgi:hypothetical protein